MKDQPTSEELGKATLAVVDDEPFICDIVVRSLSSAHKVEAFPNEVELYDALERGARFDVLLCDLMLAGVTGRKVYETVLERWPEQAPRIVFMSGITTDNARSGILEGIENPMIEKPFRLKVLRQRVAELLESEGRI